MRTGKILIGVVAAVLLVAGVVVFLHLAGGGRVVSRGRRTRRPTSASRGHPSRSVSRTLVRNATPQPSWRQDNGPVPILVYHALGEAPASEEYPGLYVSEPEFEEEMAWLHSDGYEAVTLDQVEKAWYHGGTLPAKPIVITFDNGYPEQVTFAPKVLSRYGWPGVLFEITEEHLRPFEIRPVIEIGWEVDSHSATHPDLTELSGKELEYQVAASRRYLRRKFGVPSDNFCYPSSQYDAATIAAVKEAGYVGAVTENAGYATRGQPYELDRYEIEGGDGVDGLAADLGVG
ncbi:MAG TPA: polysaccharide deacetylase family protein [Solirubrobacterales bacterium]|jgi:peptidoglycan/xylan/chitin deacetylase (PgdA/CDA1 family)|nr:polysaccharide deacetylase family protein [Solirubrobacterales bacterium]